MIDYVQALNEAQYAAATCGNGPVLVVAGAGSGKTRTIVYRLAWLAEHGVDPASILLLTFTRKAAQEMLHRAGLLLGQGLSGVQGGTFHAFAFGVLRRWKPAWLGERPFTLMDASDITEAIKFCKDALKLGKGDRSFPKSQTIVSLLSKARNKELPLDEILRREAFHLLPHAQDLALLDEAYTAYRRDKALMDYDDLLFELESLLRDNPAAADQLRQRYRYILVDEYQDTNLVQARIVRLLAGPLPTDGAEDSPASGAATGNVMAVGDEAQSIYAFRGANVRNILDFPTLFPGAQVIRLEENYRSTKPVLDVANCLLEHAAESFRKNLYTRKEGGLPVRLITPVSDRTQAPLVVRRIRELLSEHLPHEIAVLFRASFHSYALEAALKQAGIPFRKYGGLRFTDAAHVKDIMAFARLVLNPLDLPAFSRVAAMHSGVGPKTVQKLYAVAQTGDPLAIEKAFARYPTLLEDMHFVDRLRLNAQSPAGLFTSLLEYYRPRLESNYPEDWPRRQQGLEEIIQMASGHTALDLFVAEMALESPEEDENRDEDRITLSTVHSAKGLEWNAVLIIDLVEDRFPSRHALSRPEDFEEERRLMYVACTRARQDLELFAPASIYSKAEGGTLYVNQSPFVRELGHGLVEEWLEGFGGTLNRRSTGSSARPAGLGGFAGLRPPAPKQQAREAFDDCQLSADDDDLPAAPIPPTGSVRGYGTRGLRSAALSPELTPLADSQPCAAARGDAEDQPAAGLQHSAPQLCYCRHRIFGRGKIIKQLPPDKVQVNFPGFGLKVILAEYLLMEN